MNAVTVFEFKGEPIEEPKVVSHSMGEALDNARQNILVEVHASIKNIKEIQRYMELGDMPLGGPKKQRSAYDRYQAAKKHLAEFDARHANTVRLAP
jgi:hypothetical protein